MNERELDVLKEIEYAALNGEEELKLREIESQFNAEFGKDFSFLIMKKPNKK